MALVPSVWAGYFRRLYELACVRQDDPALMLKWKQMYDSLEQVLNRCDDVGDAVQLASLRHAQRTVKSQPLSVPCT